jgi:hypothetical protein
MRSVRNRRKSEGEKMLTELAVVGLVLLAIVALLMLASRPPALSGADAEAYKEQQSERRQDAARERARREHDSLIEAKARLEVQRQKDAEAKWYRDKLAEDRARQIRAEEARRRSRY